MAGTDVWVDVCVEPPHAMDRLDVGPARRVQEAELAFRERLGRETPALARANIMIVPGSSSSW